MTNDDMASYPAQLVISADRFCEMQAQLNEIQHDIKETKEVFLKIWAFIESMKDSPMLAAMTGGLGKK